MKFCENDYSNIQILIFQRELTLTLCLHPASLKEQEMVAEGQSSVTWRSRSSRGIFVGSHLLGHTTGYLGHWYWWVYVHSDKHINASIFYINMYCRSLKNTYI